jgi:hypothetical protein
MLTMAASLWLVMRWSEVRETPREMRYIYLIIYLMALGIGVHMGCLLWLPGILLFVILFERNYLGVILLGLPLLMGFILLSKGVEYWRGPLALWVFWAAVNVFYALPPLWPEPQKAKGRAKGKRPASAPHQAVLPQWLVMSMAALGIVWLFVTMSEHGGSGAIWYVVCAGVSAASVYSRRSTSSSGC